MNDEMMSKFYASLKRLYKKYEEHVCLHAAFRIGDDKFKPYVFKDPQLSPSLAAQVIALSFQGTTDQDWLEYITSVMQTINFFYENRSRK